MRLSCCLVSLISRTQPKSCMRSRTPKHIWMVAVWPTSTWHGSTESTGPVQSCWRGYLDRLAENGCGANVAGGDNSEAARLLALYRQHRTDHPSPPPRTMNPLALLGAITAQIPAKANDAFNFIGRCAAALPKTAVAATSVDWRSLPRLIQDIGADAWPVT